jgi:hypothetical protein
MPAEARTYENGSSEMRVLLSTYGSRGEVEPVRDALGIHSLSRMGDGGPVGRCDILSRTHK